MDNTTRKHKQKVKKQQKNEVVQNTSTGSNVSGRRRLRNEEISDSDEHDVIEGVAEDVVPVQQIQYKRDLYWGPKDRPTHFLAARLTDQTLLTSIQTIYQQILDIEPDYIDCLIPVERLHLTLGNIRLAQSDINSCDHSSTLVQPCLESNQSCSMTSMDDGSLTRSDLQQKTLLDLNQAINILTRLNVELSKSASQLSIKLDGFGEFFNSTIYAKIVDEDGSLRRWVESLHVRLREEGIVLAEVFDFTPHVTLLKITRPIAFKLRTRFFDGRIMPMLSGVKIIGQQKLSTSGVQLCEKSSQFDDDGFYITPFCMSLT